MKMRNYGLIFALILTFGLVSTSNVYAENSFLVSLKYGNSGSEVIKLQKFLVDQGFLQSIYITGNFLSLTQKAVINFQKSNGIEGTGYFGPLSRAMANKKITLSLAPKATITAINVKNESNTASLIMSSSKKITWQTSNYPQNVGIDINLLRKTSDNPVAYEFVEKIAKNTTNDGSEVWIPKSGQNGSNLYIEVTCSTTYNFTSGCSLSTTPAKAF